MSQSLVGSRYDLHVVRAKPPGEAEQDYYAIHEGDVEEVGDGAPSADRAPSADGGNITG